jgi:hypothetical protein
LRGGLDVVLLLLNITPFEKHSIIEHHFQSIGLEEEASDMASGGVALVIFYDFIGKLTSATFPFQFPVPIRNSFTDQNETEKLGERLIVTSRDGLSAKSEKHGRC